MKNIALRTLVCGLLATTFFSSAAMAEKRFLGVFDSEGRPVFTEVNVIPSNLTKLKAGHSANPDLTIYDRTRDRLGVKSAKLDASVLKIADERLLQAMKKLKTKTNLIALAKEIAPLYGVDPVTVIACILAEMTFNNPTQAALQDFVANLAPKSLNFPNLHLVKDAVDNPVMVEYCRTDRGDYWSWICLETTWGTSFHAARGVKTYADQKFLLPLSAKTKPLMEVLRPGTGTSYGPAQLSLAAALRVSADVARVSRGHYEHLGIDQMDKVMAMVLGRHSTVHIVAALIARARVAYKMFAKIDTSANLGVETTLFNLGNETVRATNLARENQTRSAKNLPILLPRANYFGWFAQENEAKIRAFVAGK